VTHILPKCYCMDVLAQMHFVGWAALPASLNEEFAELIRRVLEHRNFEYEQRIFRGRQEKDEGSLDVALDRYVPLFFQDREMIVRLASELKLSGTAEVLSSLDASGHYWEAFPPDHPNRKQLSDISLFYAYRDLLLRTHHNGEGQQVAAIYKLQLELQQWLRQSLPDPSRKLKQTLDGLGIDLSDVQLLSPDWSAPIGHNGHLNVHLMMREMGWWHGAPLLLAYKDRIANKPFLSLFSEICPTLTLGENVTSDVWHELFSLTPFLGVSHQAFAFEDGRAMYWNEVGAMAVHDWEAQGKGFPLRDIYDRRLARDDQAESVFEGLRKKWGMAPTDWHVCLHMRDAKARGETEGAGESIRNTSVENYIDTVRYITEQGGWVIRMGGPKVPPLPPMPRLIDYARGPDRTALMDIQLVRRAHAFIGTTSGFAYVASSFGIPTAMLNAISSVGLLWSRDTRFALKPIQGRMLTQREATSEQLRWAYPTYESLASAGLTVNDNSSDEILETVKEVLDLASHGSSSQSSPLIDKWRTSLSIPAFYDSAVPSTYFLEKYQSSFLSDAATNPQHN
jgi:putative glycosyltransferase (TIGR04372 family)